MSNRDAKKIIESIIEQNETIKTFSDEELEALKLSVKALRDINDCRNELCLKCGNYKGSHLGLCKDCRWER